SPLSDSYNIKIVYDIDNHPDIYVIKRKLKLFSGATSLPHVYDTAKQHLCVYYRTAKEWNKSMPIVDSIVPWTSEWLYHYEFWLATGTWHGKGIHGKPKPFRKTK
nr:hypothetical protein [Bacteroidales bacterium]